MNGLPVFFTLENCTCLMVGGGQVAFQKINLLLQARANVHVVASHLCDGVAHWVKEGKITWQEKDFSATDVEGMALVFAATDMAKVNLSVFEAARALNIPINVADSPTLCTFYLPAVIDRSPITIAISTGGASPLIARQVKEHIEKTLPLGIGCVAQWADSLREVVKSSLANVSLRRRFWEEVLESSLVEQVLAGRQVQATQAIHDSLKHPSNTLSRGEVYLVGAGPGDPELLTLRALRLMQKAEVVIYDALVSPEVMKLVRKEAELIFAGKSPENHVLPQEEINEKLINLASAGKRVLRLKGGDPFIFGRGGEEIETLRKLNIPFQVVPGISAANGVAAYAGIPLTHREHAQSVMFTTGHLKDGQLNLDWQGLTRPQQTVVIYMGVGALKAICQGLASHGLPASWPAAIVQQGTLARQKVVIGTLETLPQLSIDASIRNPALIIVGEVVRLQEQLSWFR